MHLDSIESVELVTTVWLNDRFWIRLYNGEQWVHLCITKGRKPTLGVATKNPPAAQANINVVSLHKAIWPEVKAWKI